MKLFEPCHIGAVTLKNRLVMAPMSTNFAIDGLVIDAMIAYYEERAKGGVGLIVVEDGIVDVPRGNHVRNIVAVDDDRCIPNLKKLTSAAHAHGAKISIQLSHGGRRGGRISKETGCMEVTQGMLPVAPSAIAHPVTGQVVPKELSIEEIEEITEKFGESARRVAEAGFDIISIHCAHMYLCGEFLSPWANQRKDSYGGSLDGRMRFVLEIIHKIHKNVGKEVPIICRMNGEEPVGGNSLEEIQQIARGFQQAGVSALHVSVGFGASIKDPNFIPSVTPMRAPDNCIVHLAAHIKGMVSIPVIAVNKIKGTGAAEKILQEGKADLVAMGRPLVADPYLPLKAYEERFEDIRPCIYCCQGCAQNVIEKDAPLACSTNPTAGRELEGPIRKAKEKKKVLVVGAGPGGIQAALTAAERGHQVYLVEKTKEMGGQLLLASKPPGKQEINRLTTYLKNQVERSEIHVELEKEIDMEWLEQVKPDVAIVATGSDPMIPDIKDLSKKRIRTGREVLSGAEIQGNKVVIIGGGQVGCEVGEFLGVQGKEVTIIEIQDDIARDMPHVSKLPLVMALEDNGVRIMTKTKVQSVTEEGMLVAYKGNEEVLQTDLIVLATGTEPSAQDMDEVIKENVPEFYTMGDRVEGGGILEAIRAGYDAARNT
jgi:2,4-dienoyl-CoA reductase-like NADH-dependent reductase (Old Yellow Enzyme family)/thioredoxin reductase